MNKPIFSIIIPCRVETPYLKETLTHLKKQTQKSFEIIVVTDKSFKDPSPAAKRNYGARLAKGEHLAFIDDDSYPDPTWLENALKVFEDQPDLSAVCGPCLTPPKDNLRQQASGLVWSSYLGSGGAGTYRNKVSTPRYVDDYPSVNLIIKKSDFWKVKGFNTHHWPGEDTILCLDLTRLGKKIFYHPNVVVYHHRRSVVIPHLQQITRYALHRGNFARIYPQTSFRPGYLIPSLFFIYCTILPFLYSRYPVTLLPLIAYLILLIFTFFSFLFENKKSSSNIIITAVLATITIPFTHLYYGILFLVGFFTPSLKFKAHEVNKSTSSYIGG